MTVVALHKQQTDKYCIFFYVNHKVVVFLFVLICFVSQSILQDLFFSSEAVR